MEEIIKEFNELINKKDATTEELQAFFYKLGLAYNEYRTNTFKLNDMMVQIDAKMNPM